MSEVSFPFCKLLAVSVYFAVFMAIVLAPYAVAHVYYRLKEKCWRRLNAPVWVMILLIAVASAISFQVFLEMNARFCGN
ncbi:hypothetical protein LRB11_14060 [Ectothiorhodospira haloalkaliphila]|uniref:hypothetical protein n=1 Tax=Ectothiorhodospira haloalkaliphila TaxID=421628 RepID=UPI001EE85FA1|nr:hypothetical protein [Ectothiorhodospira haloalkaliphila]MCG5526045.1 hypothetical protein [Ectothiorhodospira haloalkaliphila]